MESKPQQDDKLSELLAAHQKDKRREAKLYIWIGAIFIVWTAFDVVSGIFEEIWYVNILFGLLGLAMLVYGLVQSRTYKKNSKPNE